MAHEAFDRQTETSGTVTQVYKANGEIYFQQTLTRVRTRSRDFSAASTQNPILVGGFRRMSPWTRFSGSREGVIGKVGMTETISDTVYEALYDGVLAGPGASQGSILPPFPQGKAESLRNALGHFGENDLQFGVAMQEVGSTVDLVSKYYRNANTLAGKLTSAVQGSRRVRQQFRDFLRNGWRDVPGAYLEYLFGMKPLADDISNAVQVLQDRSSEKAAFTMQLRGKFQADDSFRSSEFYSPDAGALSNVEADVTVKQLNRAVLRFQLPDWYWDRLPPVTFFRQAWETTRLSFVLDWVLPISSWLSGFEGFQLRPFFAEGSVSEKLERTVVGAYWDPPTNWWFDPVRAGGTDRSYSRSILDSFPGEELFSLPRLRTQLGLSQLRVGSALLGQRLAKLQHMI